MNERPTGRAFATEASEMFAGCAKILQGHHMFVQGAVLADLLAMWLASHFTSDPEETAKMREQVLAEHIEAVRIMIEHNEKIILNMFKSLPHH